MYTWKIIFYFHWQRNLLPADFMFKYKKGYQNLIPLFLWPRQESNLDLELRKLLYYPLYYEAGWQNSCHGKWLMPKLYNITAEYLYRNGQQYYAKKFSYDHHSIRTQRFFYPLQ